MVYGSGGVPHPNGDVAVTDWYNERSKYYWYGREPDMSSFQNWGHFTQVVWKGSHRVGVGCASTGNSFIVVGNYDPHGNVMQHFGENVQ